MTATESTPAALPPDEIERLARHLRVRSVQMADAAGSGHPTSSMSAADLVAVLIAGHVRLDPHRPDALGNDRILFSKGHASPLLYAALAAMGLLDESLGGFADIVDAYRQRGSVLEGHPTPRVPGVPAATGALGLGLAIGVGLTMGQRMAGIDDAHTWVLCGDGELAEGAVWEAVEHAGSRPLAGLTAIVDVNRLGQTGATRHGWDLDAYAARFGGFGWATCSIDGHDLEEIDAAFRRARASDVPTAILARTEKGRGASETSDQLGKHGKPLDDPEQAIEELGGEHRVRFAPLAPDTVATHRSESSAMPKLPSWEIGDEVATRDAFGETLVALGRAHPQLVAIDAEVENSTRLAGFADEYPARFVQAFIAEQLMAGTAIGLDATSWHPLMATFGAFLTRAHDVLRMATISRSDITVVGSHAGVSIGEDGPSQMALDDLAMMRALHGSTVLSPCDANQTASLLDQLIGRPGIGYLRVLRGTTPVIYEAGGHFPIGGSRMVVAPAAPQVTIVATGVTVHEAVAAARRLSESGIAAQVLDAYSVKPLDAAAIATAAEASELVVVEDHRPEGGLGKAVAMAITESGVSCGLTHLAVREVPGSATPEEQRREAGIDADAIVAAAERLVG